MELALVGLGRMGLNMALRLLRGGHRVVGHNLTADPYAALEAAGGERAVALADLRDKLAAPRVVWLMLPAGEVTEGVARQLFEILEPGDTIIDGANSRYTDTLRLAGEAHARGLHVVDAGVSGGIWGLENGYSVMLGGSDEAFARVRPVIETLAPAPDRGWGHVGPVGAGHFTKMVHNGIEYGMMQAFAEGFAILDAKKDFGGTAASLDLGQIAELWRSGSVVQSWLLDLAADALRSRPGLGGIAPFVPDSGEGRWTIEEAIALRVPATVLAASLFERFSSRQDDSFAYKLLSALRGQFGGHAVQGVAGHPELNADGTIDVVPGGPKTEGARVLGH